jgi:tRNA (guanine10-N2)-methyltransferase
MQRDILDFAVRSLVPNGRLAMWMPTTNDEAVEFPVPMHPNLEVIAVSVQYFSNCTSVNLTASLRRMEN